MPEPDPVLPVSPAEVGQLAVDRGGEVDESEVDALELDAQVLELGCGLGELLRQRVDLRPQRAGLAAGGLGRRAFQAIKQRLALGVVVHHSLDDDADQGEHALRLTDVEQADALAERARHLSASPREFAGTLQPLDLPAGAEDLHAVEVEAALFALAQEPVLVPLVVVGEMLAHDRVDADLVTGAAVERDLDAGKPPSDCARDPEQHEDDEYDLEHGFSLPDPTPKNNAGKGVIRSEKSISCVPPKVDQNGSDARRARKPFRGVANPTPQEGRRAERSR